ncbi:twin transmembrane helix small protein [Roseibium sp. SCPC15]|uniref:twin transmembrane helix small protein n=1 Tax=Roseibium sp. SCP15 TaxID=3141376 RepID=UPI003339003F
MADIINILIPVGMVAVLVVLLLGIWNMFRNGPANRSQMLMRWRVGLQFLVIVLVMGGLYFFGTGS